ncbi:uncharacterized protein BO97DRAFT_447484 [Aspergillus homomorphus CBS 101889]|uniref:GPI anchored protein n=1 Tax=Aspergillus homomorphus (strain CBS 101889) TaxID=1450537 RepID=A0A395HG82_ASPHC|nr:hypothetical protein BO97DRAFT_447484 [Aspergillus homomorphus CBS 101889]RAL06519.1 hypothetical protein BO97DRAFT_447484 [Aspergillus homomorphus CBS 101889]
MKIFLALVPVLAGLTVAEEVVSMLLWAVDRDQQYDASIVGNDATATTYSIACPTSAHGSDCSIGRAGITAEIIDTSTYAWWRRQYSDTWACTAEGTTDGVCHRTLSGEDQGIDIYFTNFLSATVTAGSVTGGSSMTATATSTSATAFEKILSSTFGPSPTAEPSTEKTENAAATAATETSAGGAPRVTAAARLFLGSAGIALIGAAL